MHDDKYERGAIKYIERYKQLISYVGLERHRHITPTDIDGVIDYNGNAFLYMECKHDDLYSHEGLSNGQRIALENMVKANGLAGKPSMAIVFTHTCNTEQIIVASDKIVREIYSSYKECWKPPKNKAWTVLEAVEWFEEDCKSKNIAI